MALIGLSSLIVSVLMYLFNKESMHNLKTNHFAHLEADTKNNTRDIERLRENVTDIYNKISEISEDLAFIKGKLNGSIK